MTTAKEHMCAVTACQINTFISFAGTRRLQLHKDKKITSIWPEDTQAGKSSSYVRENLEICTFNTFIIQETLLKSQEENEWLRKLT